jgi:hypothetical protein
LLELVIKFLLGGAIVSLFAITGELFKPKTFSGIFGAAPSVAIATLALAYGKHGCSQVALLARSMVFGALALCVYGAICVVATRRTHWPVWVPATAAWLAWFMVALGGWGAAQAVGVLR